MSKSLPSLKFVFILMTATFLSLQMSSCVKELCDETCKWSKDGECDDGGDGSLYDHCDLGTDCQDCGTRESK